MKKIDSKKIIYLPGWMDKVSLHGEFEGLEIWEENIDPEKKIETEYLVAHSLGTHFALLNWEKNQNTKLILINPPLLKRPLHKWASIWVDFFAKEGKNHVNSNAFESPTKL